MGGQSDAELDGLIESTSRVVVVGELDVSNVVGMISEGDM